MKTDSELASELEKWANNRERLNLNAAPLWEAIERLRGNASVSQQKYAILRNNYSLYFNRNGNMYDATLTDRNLFSENEVVPALLRATAGGDYVHLRKVTVTPQPRYELEPR